MSDRRTKITAAARRNKAMHALGSRVLRSIRRDRREPISRGPLAEYASLLPAGNGRIVVVLARARQRRRVQPWLRQFAGDRVHVISAGTAPEWQQAGVRYTHHVATSPGDIADHLKLIGPVDVIVDVRPDTVRSHQETWRWLFFHLRPGGLYVVASRAVQGAGFRPGMNRWIARITTADRSVPGPSVRSRDRALADATAGVVLSRDLLVITKRHRHYLKLRDAETNRVLASREPVIGVSELMTLPGGELVSKAEVISHQAAVPIPVLPERMTYPPMHLRHYRGRIAFAGYTLLHTESSILPDSFRWHLERSPRNPLIKSVSPSFARIPDELRPERTLDGNFYQLDPQWPDLYGHLMTEIVGRLWGWDAAKRQIPDLKALFRTRRNNARDAVEYRLLRAYGIAEEDIVGVRQPVYVDSLVSATVMWHNKVPSYAHPALVEIWDRMRHNLVDPNAPSHDRIFISRPDRLWRRPCRNAGEVEELFESHGFTVIYPEQLELATQASIFASAPIIAGFRGSAMFNVMYAKSLKTMILLGHEGYTARNEHLYSSLLGCSVHYFWSSPDTPYVDGKWVSNAFRSSWEFDFARNQRPLEELLASL